MKELIMGYLANGVKPADVSTIVGCTPAYVSQLLAQEDFRTELSEKIANQPEDAMEARLDTKYESIEHKLLKQMEEAMLSAELPAITNALKVVGERQDRMKIRRNPHLQPQTNVNIISLTLPAHQVRRAPTVEMNERQEVLSIGNHVLAPMSVDGVKGLFERMRGPQNDPNTIEVSAAETPLAAAG